MTPLSEQIQATKYPTLENSLNNFWNALLSVKDDHGLAFALIRFLRHTNEFNKIYWLEQMLHRCTASIGRKAYGHLFVLIWFEADLSPYPLLEIIRGWFDNPDKSDNSHANKYAVCLLTDSCIYLFENTKFFKQKNSSLIDFPLFISLTEEETQTKIDFTVKWLFHERAFILYKDYGWYNNTHEHNLAFILEQWYALSLVSEDSKELFDKVLISISQNVPFRTIKKIQLKISESLRKLRIELEKLSRVEIRNSSLKTKRDNLKFLITKLKSIKK